MHHKQSAPGTPKRNTTKYAFYNATTISIQTTTGKIQKKFKIYLYTYSKTAFSNRVLVFLNFFLALLTATTLNSLAMDAMQLNGEMLPSLNWSERSKCCVDRIVEYMQRSLSSNGRHIVSDAADNADNADYLLL